MRKITLLAESPISSFRVIYKIEREGACCLEMTLKLADIHVHVA